MMSAGPPGGKGTIIRTVRLGKLAASASGVPCAKAGATASAKASAMRGGVPCTRLVQLHADRLDDLGAHVRLRADESGELLGARAHSRLDSGGGELLPH